MAISDKILEAINGTSSSKNNAGSSGSSSSTSSYTRHTPVVSSGQYNSRYGGSYTSKATTTSENTNKATIRYTDKEGNTTVYTNKELKEYQQELKTLRSKTYTVHTPAVSSGTYNSRDSKNNTTQSESILASTLSKIYKYWSGTNSWEKYINLFKSDTQNPNSDIYSPYIFNKTYTYGKYAADNEARTQTFETQWADAKAKAAYWAGRTDLNLSDDDIIERVNLNGYSEIKKVNEAIQSGDTRYYTRELNYSPDILYAVIWEARNEGGSGNELADLIQWQNGEGNVYHADEIIQSRQNPADENYNPYIVGATYDDAALYFGVSQFDEDWLTKNRYLLNGSDDDIKMYQKVYSAEQTTLQAEKEAAELKARMADVFATNMDDPDEIMDILFDTDEYNPRGYTDALTQLGKLDESLKSGKIISTTRPIDYSYNDVRKQVEQHCEELKTQTKTSVVADEISTITSANNVSPVANTQIDEARDEAAKAAGSTIRAVGSDAEKIVFKTSVSGFENYVQQITDAITNGTMTEEDAYVALLNGANEYAAKHYLEMREAEDSRAALLELQEVTTDSGEYLNEMFDKEDATINNIIASYTLAAEYGGDVSGKDTISFLTMMDYLYDNGKEYVPTEWSATTAFDLMLSYGFSTEDVNTAAQQTITEKQKEIDEIDAVLTQVKDAGIKGASKYVKNLERKKEAAQQDIQDAQYYLIPQEAKDFDEVVEDFQKRAVDTWGGFHLFAVFTHEKNGIAQEDARFAMQYTYENGERVRVRGEDQGSERYINYMTDDEIDTYLYLAATKGHEEAQTYYKHLQEELLPVRMSIATQETAGNLAESGALGAAAATALSVATSPLQIAGSIYSVVQAFRGEEINPYHSSFAANMFISSARGTVKEEINETFGGEDAFGAKVANVMYDALTSSGDSLLSAGLGAGSNVASVLLMGTEAASGAVMDAKMRGASNADALLYGGITLLAESGTEFLPMEKIADAFKGANATKVRQFLVDVFKNVALEGVGESINEIIEGVGDDVIMQEFSNRNMAIEQYIADGMSEEEATRQATSDFWRDVMYAGITGGVSGSMSMTVSTIAGKIALHQDSKQISTLMTALESDKAAQAASLSGVLQHAGIDMETARAAGQTLVDKVGGEKAILAAAQIIRSSPQAEISSSESLKALANSILANNGAETQIGDFSKGTIDAETLRGFVVQSMDAANANQQQIQQAVTNNAVANAAREIIGDGALDGIKPYEVAEKQARENLRQARAGYASAQEGVKAAQNNLIDVQKLFLENPSDPKLAGMMQQATGNVEAKTKVLNEYAMSVLKYEGQYDTARQTLKEMRTSAMKTVRQQAVERVSQLRTERAAQYLTAMQQSAGTAIPSDSVRGSGMQYYNAMQQNQNTAVEAAPVLATETNNGVESAGANTAANGIVAEAANTTVESQENASPVVSPVETARALAEDLGIGATLGTRKMDTAERGSVPSEVLGYYNQRAKYMAIRQGEASSYAVTMHEAGHAIADKTGMTGTQEMIQNLDPSFAQNYSAEELSGEAFAEFTSLYMQDSAQAEAFAGTDFVRQFESALEDAGISETVHAARDRIQAYVNANTLERMKAGIINQADTVKKDSLGERLSKAVTAIFDWTHPLETVDKSVKKGTGEYGNVQTAAKRRNFSERVVSNMFTNALTAPDGTIIDESFSSAFTEIKPKDSDTFITYMLSKHSLDRNAQNKQVFANDISTEQIQKTVRELETSHPEFAPALKKFENLWQEFMQSWMVDTGLLSREDFDTMKAMYPNYVPTQRYLGNESGYRGGGKGAFTIKSAKGSDLQIINPLESIANYVNRIVDTVYKNNAALQFHEAYQNAEGLGLYAREITSDMRRESVDTTNVQENVKSILEENDVDSDVLSKVLNAIGEEAVGWRDIGTSTEGNVLAVQLPDGSKRYYQFTQQGKQIFEALTGNGKATSAQTSKALKPFAHLTSFVSKMATTYAPTFAASNPIKDFSSSVHYGSWASNYATGIAKWIKGFYEVWKEKGEYKDYLALGGGGWNAVQTTTKQGSEQYMSKLFKKYWKRDTKSRIKHIGEKAIDVVTLNRLNEIVENTSRYVEYRFGKHNKSTAEGKMQAFQEAQNVTTDFASGGSSKAAVAARSLVPFLNPQLQGTYRAMNEFTGKEMGRTPVRFAKRFVNTAMVTAIAAVLRNTLGDDDDKERYEDISDEIKTTHVIIPNFFNPDSDRRWLRIPISQDPFDQAVYTLINSSIEQFDGTDDFTTELLAGASAIVSNVTFGLSDLILDDGDLSSRLNGIMSSTTLGPVWGLVTNQNYYGGKIISDQLADRSAPLQYDDTTPELFVWLGRTLGVSPKAIEYLVDQYGGYGGQLLTNTASSLMTDDWNWTDTLKSLLTSFHKRFTIDSAYTNDVSSAYSAGKSFMSELKTNVEDTGLDGGLLRSNLTEDERKAAYEEATAMTSKGGIIYDTNKELSALWQQVNEAKDNPNLTDAERNRLILSLRDEIVDKQMAANDALTEYYGKYVTGQNLFESFFNRINEVTPYTKYEKLSSTFTDDYDSGADYMQKSYSVWESIQDNDSYTQTKKNNVLPHPNESFSRNGVTYEIGDDEWGDWENAYRDGYQNYVDTKSVHWETMTEEEKIELLGKAHDAGHKAATKWYLQTHEKPSTTNK